MPDGSGFRGPHREDKPERIVSAKVMMVPGRLRWWMYLIAPFYYLLIFSVWLFSSPEGLFLLDPPEPGRRARNRSKSRSRLNWRHPGAIPLCLLILVLSPLLMAIALFQFVGDTIAKQRRLWRARRKGASDG